ncbi:MAG TPA: PHP domain-containing protein [Gemmatimonadaceae bacterium]|nr:PHP domain-containing protein [Gemmatimonadaceae bacterium]
MVRADFHTHTCYSHDGHQTPRELVARAREVQIDRIAVTDHHTIDGALRAHDLDPDRVIVGEEITSRCGIDVIGLYLRKRIEPRLPLEQIVEEIRAQGGVVYLPHPFAYLVTPRQRAERALPFADIVEVWNSRAFYPPWNRRALAAVRARGLGEAAGSDGHFSFELGRALTVLPNFGDADTLKLSAKEARVEHDGRTHWLPFVGSVACMAVSWIKGLGARA